MKHLRLLFASMFAVVLAVACTPAVTPTPVATSTPVPTPTPSFSLQCNITAERYGFSINGESGEVTNTMHSEQTSYQYAASGQRSGVTVNIDRDMTYTNSKNTYKLSGQIVLNLLTNTVSYTITATGGAFGNTPQTCKN